MPRRSTSSTSARWSVAAPRTACARSRSTAIVGTFEPGRARQFDRAFRPVERTRRRWLRVWVADDLPPISVVKVGERYALLDGHHRVSVASARGAETIPAIIS